MILFVFAWYQCPGTAGAEEEEDDYSKRSIFTKIKGVVTKTIQKIDQKLTTEDDDQMMINNVAIEKHPENGLPDILVVFKDIKVTNLFYLDTIHPPKPYISIKYQGYQKRTTGEGVTRGGGEGLHGY